ncbi:unnamed protein product [Mytilus coruscus]|uniref:Uncharacterized protein n=1 Tax=Mytilus coruscus TaxID=42192 RepID=A0A6J8A4G5_MYTCO|nr:unnamed protein product [Mytilus coruscus]
MASLSPEEENYARLSLLLTGLSPRATRIYFDREFPPVSLTALLTKEHNILFELNTKKIINPSQWNLLFPRVPDVANSKTFDIALMITLLRNLAKPTPPYGGFDHLPTAAETTPDADLARIKHYRNVLAHKDDGKIIGTDFNTAWDNIEGAIHRLGGPQMKEECDHLKSKALDQTNQQIMIDIKRSYEEITELKESMKSLTLTYVKMKEMINETVPWNIRERNRDRLKEWKNNDDKMFIKTRAAEHVLKCIKENACVTITASFGVGKTSILRHVALQMAELEYDVLPVTDPSDIVKYYNPKRKSLFLVDDLFGNFSVDQSDMKNWEPVIKDIKEIIEKKESKVIAACRLQIFKDEKFESLSIFTSCICNLLSKKMRLSKTEKRSIAELYLNTKAPTITEYYNSYDCFPLLCRQYHAKPAHNSIDVFQNVFLVYKAEIDMLRKRGHHVKYCVLALCVMFNNKLKEETLTEELNEGTRTIIQNTCEACRLERGTSRLVLQGALNSLKGTFIRKEQKMYKIINDKVFDFLIYLLGQQILPCLIKNAESSLIKERFLLKRTSDMDEFTVIISPKYQSIFLERMVDDWSKGEIKDVFSNINMKKPKFRKLFLAHLNTLGILYQIHLANICIKRTSCKTKVEFKGDEEHGHQFNDNNDVDKEEAEGEGGIDEKEDDEEEDNEDNDDDVEDNDDDQEDNEGDDERDNGDQGGADEVEAEKTEDEEEDYDTAFLHICYIGDISLVQWCCNLGVNINKCTNDGQYPVMKACEHGHTKIIKELLERGVDLNICDRWGRSLLMTACEHGHREIVEILLNKGVDYNKCDIYNQLPVMIACKHGYTQIVKMLIESGVNCNKCDHNGLSLITIACEYGHIEIVQMLLERGANFAKCCNQNQSPASMACVHGHTEIVKMLLDRGADCNDCDSSSRSLVVIACEYGYTEILKMLLDKGAVYTQEDNICLYKKVACDEYFNYTKSPMRLACEHGYLEIVKMFLDTGVDYNICDMKGQSLLFTACAYGHTEIVKLLLERGADYTRCDNGGQSPLTKDCEKGYTKIMKILSDIEV